MDDAFQALMPLENSASVYTLVYPGGSTPIEGQGSGESQFDFLQFLLAQLTTSLGTSDQSTFAEFLPFELPVNPSLGEESSDSLSMGEVPAGLSNGTMPFLSVLGEQGFIFPGSDFLQQQGQNEGNETVAQPFEQFAFSDQGNRFISGMDEIPETLFTREVSSASVVEKASSEQMTGDLFNGVQSKVPFSDVTTMETIALDGDNGKPMMQTISVSEMGDLVENKIRGSGESSIESILSHAEHELIENYELSLQQRVDLKNLEGIQLLQEDYFKLQSENAVLAGASQENAQIVDYLQNTGQPIKMGVPVLNHFMGASDFLDTSGLQQGDTPGSDLSQSYEQSSFQDTKQAFNLNDFMNFDENATPTPVPGSENDVHFESVLEGRIRQTQEVQAVAQQIIKSASLRYGNNFSEMRLNLEPEYLGNLRLNIMVEGDAVFAKFVTDNEYTRDVLTNNLAVLKDSLESSGIRLGDVEVSMEKENAGFDSFQGNSDTANENTSEEEDYEHDNNFQVYENVLETSQMNTATASPVETDGYHVNYLV